MSSRSANFPEDAIALLSAEHRELLDQFERILALHPHEREQQWRTLRKAMKLHMAVEAELLFPAFLDATEDSLTHFVASVGHENITAEMQDASEVPCASGMFLARVRSLKKVFAHHVSDMEKDGGMFDEASLQDES
jgi:hypothetical protein